MQSSIHYCLGIDGGGTKTEGVLTDTSGRVLCAKKYGASNPNDVGLEASAKLISTLISDLLADGGHIPPAEVSVFAGIAGALSHRNTLAEAIEKDLPPLGALTVHSDVINLLAAHTPLGEGICLICGTGSVCFARFDDTLIRVGGWGYLLDRAGSGYDIGRMALQIALEARDGRASAEACRPLIEALAGHLGRPPEDAIGEIYEKGKPFIAACAPVVFGLARKGDPVAEQILYDNALALAGCIAAALKQIPDIQRVPVILGGSICVKEAPAWTDRIQGLLPAPAARRAVLQVCDAPPVLGALLEAAGKIPDFDRENAFSDFAAAFRETYAT